MKTYFPVSKFKIRNKTYTSLDLHDRFVIMCSLAHMHKYDTRYTSTVTVYDNDDDDDKRPYKRCLYHVKKRHARC